jgi:hypothetical protein
MYGVSSVGSGVKPGRVHNPKVAGSGEVLDLLDNETEMTRAWT